MVWPFMGALGSARGISSEAISTDLAMATFGGIAAGFSAALLGLRCGRRLPLIIGTLALVLSSIGLVSDTANYSLCAILFLFSWVFVRSEEHTSELQSLMRISYAVFCLKKNKQLQ